MTSGLGRIYVFGAALLLFLLLWAGIAARPWVSAAPDRRLAALDVRQQRLSAQLIAAQRQQAARWSAYRSAATQRQRQVAAAATVVAPAPTPTVRIVQLPALATTRTS